jgi:hypothetical protein
MSMCGSDSDCGATGPAGPPMVVAPPGASSVLSAAPRRRRRWVWWVAASYVLLLVVVRLLWGWEAQRRFDAAVAKYRALGQPVLIEDFARPAIPDAENGGLVIEEAFRKLQLTRDQQDCIDAGLPLELVREYRGNLAAALAQTSEAQSLVRKARAYTEFVSGPPLTSPLLNALLPQLAPARRLAKALCLRSKAAHVDGNDEEALQSLQDVWTVVRATEGHTPTLITHLTAVAMGALASANTQDLLPELVIAGGPEAPHAGVPAAPATLHALIEALLDDARTRADLVESLCAERLVLLDTAMLCSEGRHSLVGIASMTTPRAPAPVFPQGLQPAVLGPLLTLDGLWMFEFGSAAAAAVQAPDWPACRAELPQWPASCVGLQHATRVLSRMLMPALDMTAQIHFRGLADRRMAAIALAMRLYEHDHGHRPATLLELVPEYLPVLPSDPFAPDGQSFGYLADTELPRLYSVHLNQTDDGGQFTITQGGSVDRNTPDRPFFLTRGYPRPKAELPQSLREALEREREPHEAQWQRDPNQ